MSFSIEESGRTTAGDSAKIAISEIGRMAPVVDARSTMSLRSKESILPLKIRVIDSLRFI